MSQVDWLVLSGTLGFIVIYGMIRTRGKANMQSYVLGDNEARWWTVGLSVMATQASAITFMSTPGQAFHDGMGFVQFYFGLPIAMVIICYTFIPIYYRLKVYTAYEFLEQRFDVRTRALTSILFLVQRGLAAGITIFAPAIILSTILGWNLTTLNIIIGLLVILYTVTGGSKAVNTTQKQQMFIIFLGMFAAFYVILDSLPPHVGFSDAMEIAAGSEKLNILDFSLDLSNRYTFWSGITGGLFLALSYFGTDQSQVQRYLSGRSVRESRLGLIFNGILKVPMQFFILLVGVMVFVFYQFVAPPLFFNKNTLDKLRQTEASVPLQILEQRQDSLFRLKTELLKEEQLPLISKSSLHELQSEEKKIREEVRKLVKSHLPAEETNDKDYVFISFVLGYLPKGLVGLLLAVIFCAAMSSTSSELNALASTTTVDIYRRIINIGDTDEHYVTITRLFTVIWGVVAIIFACFGSLFENLIQFVNIIGSLFYGTILGIFMVAFYVRLVQGKAIFYAALISEVIVLVIYYLDIVSYLWLNVIGCLLVMTISIILQAALEDESPYNDPT